MTPDERLAHARAAVAAAEARGEVWQGWTEQERAEVNMGYQREPDPARAHAEAESMRRIAAMPFVQRRTEATMTDTTTTQQQQQQDRPAAQRSAREVIREAVEAGCCWSIIPLEKVSKETSLAGHLARSLLALRALLDAPEGAAERLAKAVEMYHGAMLGTSPVSRSFGAVVDALAAFRASPDSLGPGPDVCSDATARDETNRQLREAQRLLDEEVRTAETWRDRCFKAEKERDEARKALADERAAHKDMKAQLLAEVKAAWTVALPEGAFSERARLTYEGAKWVMDAMSGVDHTFASAVPIAVERANALLRAAEAEAAKGASGEGGA